MPVLMMFEAPGMTTEQYDKVNEIMGIHGDEDEPEGLIDHVAGMDGDTLVVVDVWESADILGRFAEERLQPAMAEAGVTPSSEPRVLPVHNRLPGNGTDAGVLVLIEIDDLGTDAYDQMSSTMEAHQPGGEGHPGVMHTAAKSESGGVLVADVWESPEAFAKFGEEQVGPAGAEVGLGPIDPRMVPVYNRTQGRARESAG